MRPLGVLAGAAALSVALSSSAAASVRNLPGVSDADPDWPCIQRLVPELAAAQLWRGSPMSAVEPVESGSELDALAEELAARRVALEEAERLVAGFAEGLGPAERDEELARLFTRTLALINQDRSSIIAGIKRYARGQRQLAQQISEKNDRLQALGQQELLARQELMMQRDWDIRVFDDRRNSLTYLCEQPVLLEQRAFALARTMANHLE